MDSNAKETIWIDVDEDMEMITLDQSKTEIPLAKSFNVENILFGLQSLFPDAQLDFISNMISKVIDGLAERNDISDDSILDAATNAILDMTDYPKSVVRKSLKRKLVEESSTLEDQPALKIQKTEDSFNNPKYLSCCKEYLLNQFNFIPSTFIQKTLHNSKNNLLEAYEKLTEMDRERQEKNSKIALAFVQLKRPRAVKLPAAYEQTDCTVFQKQLAEIQKISCKAAEDNTCGTESLVKCGCCDDELSFSKMTCCEDGHLFCMTCAKSYFESQIGFQRAANIKCMDIEGCSFGFSVSEIKRFLCEKSFSAYSKCLQSEDLNKANLANFVTCPFCEFGAIVENEQDRIFLCQNPDCGIESCRLCREESHIPMTCAETKKVDLRHEVEEAMTVALVRECPKCKKRFFKTDGCNKMTCICGQHMCYVCRQPVKDYSHFKDSGRPASSECPLYDDTVKRNESDVKIAADAAILKLLAENSNLSSTDLHV